jgi:hypothetical protein
MIFPRVTFYEEDKLRFFLHLRGVFPSNPDDPIKEKPLKLGRFLFLAFINMATSNLNVVLAVLLSHRRSASAKSAAVAFFVPPSTPSGGLLGEGEASQLTLHTQPSQQH